MGFIWFIFLHAYFKLPDDSFTKFQTCLSKQHDRQCTYNVILRCVRATIFAVESNKYCIFWVCIFSLSYRGYNAYAPYCHLWPVRFYNIFPHYLTNGTIFEKEKSLLNIKCVFWFSLQLLSETFLILRSNERDAMKMYIGLHVKYLLFLSDFHHGTWIFMKCFQKILKYQISRKYVQ